MITREKIQEIADKVAREFQPEKIILFGSFAWGTPTEDSDVDLFIVKDTNDTREFARTVDGALFPRLFPIDIIVYTPEKAKKSRESDFFIKNIFSKGKVLYAA